METIDKLKDIIRKNGMSTRPEYYSGRGAIRADLNDKILFGMHKDIKEKFGEKPAKAFVQMVDKIKVLSATTFLQELYALHDNGWKVYKGKDAPGVLVGKNEDGSHNLANGLLGMLSALTSDRDETEAIKSHFLRSNGIKRKAAIEYYGWRDDGN